VDPGAQGIVGNIDITGGIRDTAAIVSGGEIGDNGLATGLFVNSGTIKGILAAEGPISSVSTGQTKFAFVFNDVGRLAAIDAIFSDLATIVTNLNHLHVVLVNGVPQLSDSPP
jgi:hypothetical protein